MRKILLSTFLGLALISKAQEPHMCGTTDVTNQFFIEHPELKAKFEQHLKASEVTEEMINNHKNKTAAATVTIPIVFHILHTGGGENISDAQIQDAVSILNRDYQKLNPDTTVVLPVFKSRIADVQFAFVLAKIDPSGNCTNGIIRHYDTKTNWSSNNPSFYAYTWPANKYLNVYVVKSISSGAAGYTFLPGTPIPGSMDAIVILSNYVGSIGTGNPFTSRALTHEVGHWCNLEHTWGSTNNPEVACGDDGVSDTPITKGFSSCPVNNSDVCTPGTPENLQNYMDYSYCSRMFTTGQGVRMQAALNSPTAGRNNLSSPANLAATGITSSTTNCIPMVQIMAAPSLSVCSGTPLTINSYTSNAPATSYSWSSSVGTINNSTLASISINFPGPGSATVTCVASNTNGSNSASVVVTILNGQSEITQANSESFENNTIPNFWNVLNPTTTFVKWEPTVLAASQGSVSFFIPGETAVSNGIETLETPAYDFLNNPNFGFTFKYAYARQTPTHNDIFKVQASSNCGSTWTDVYVPSIATMAANSGGVSNVPFVPSPAQWVLYNLGEHPNFGAFLTMPSVRLRFYFQEDAGGVGFGNRIYLDEINFDIPAGINEFTRQIQLQLMPNPSNGDFKIQFTLSDPAAFSYELTSVTGQLIERSVKTNLNPGKQEKNIQKSSELSAGIYFLTLDLNGIKAVKKIVVN